MLPVFYIQPVSIIVSVIVGFIFGGLWYGPFFGLLWADLIGHDTSKPPSPSEVIRGLLLNILGTTLTSFVFTHLVQVVRPSSWGIENQDEDKVHTAFVVALFVWVGFFIPLALNGVAWEKRSWGLFFLNIAYYFFHTQILAFIAAVTV